MDICQYRIQGIAIRERYFLLFILTTGKSNNFQAIVRYFCVLLLLFTHIVFCMVAFNLIQCALNVLFFFLFSNNAPFFTAKLSLVIMFAFNPSNSFQLNYLTLTYTKINSRTSLACHILVFTEMNCQ